MQGSPGQSRIVSSKDLELHRGTPSSFCHVRERTHGLRGLGCGPPWGDTILSTTALEHEKGLCPCCEESRAEKAAAAGIRSSMGSPEPARQQTQADAIITSRPEPQGGEASDQRLGSRRQDGSAARERSRRTRPTVEQTAREGHSGRSRKRGASQVSVGDTGRAPEPARLFLLCW